MPVAAHADRIQINEKKKNREEMEKKKIIQLRKFSLLILRISPSRLGYNSELTRRADDLGHLGWVRQRL